jgi:hypothetical protein
MLGPGRYLLGVLEILLLGGFAWLGAAALRAWLLPRFEGAPAHLATAVLSLALLIWWAELLGSFGALDPLPYLLLVAASSLGVKALLARVASREVPGSQRRHLPRREDPRAGFPSVSTLVALAIAAVAAVHFAAGVKAKLSTGMTGFDSTWYHGPFAAGFFQSGDTWSLHYIAPQFLAWFYPANAEIFHTVGMLAFGRDILSPLLNLGWFVGCLVACWCIGRPHRVAPWSLALGAVALSVPALADQAGEARNDIVGMFFLLAAVAIALNARLEPFRDPIPPRIPGTIRVRGSLGTCLVVGLAAGLAAGTKLNFLLPAAVLVIGMVPLAPRGARVWAFGVTALAALAGGGYWYLRNLAHAGNPLPWINSLGPISLPAPEQALGGREAHSVLAYLTDGAVWSDWLLPGLRDGLWIVWPLLLIAALGGLVLCLLPAVRREAGSRSALPLAGLAGLATAAAWLLAPTSASGPEGMPRGFESGLRYLAPALVLGLALLPAAAPLRTRLGQRATPHSGARMSRVALAAVLLLALGAGYPVQRHYLEGRYAEPTFTAPGLNGAFAWARDLSGARVATTSTRQYPLFGGDLSNRVQYLGRERPHGGFEAPRTCRQFRRLLDAGDYDYLIATRDREEAGKPPYPPAADWAAGAGARVILRKPPTVVFELTEGRDLATCR